jgi:hypothetical protein
MQWHVQSNQSFSNNNLVHLDRLGSGKAIPCQEGLPTITTKAQMVDDNEFNQAVMEKASINLLMLESFRHLVKTTQEIMRHVQRIAYKIHQQPKMIEKYQAIPTFTGHKLFNNYQKIVPPGFEGNDRHTSITGSNLP